MKSPVDVLTCFAEAELKIKALAWYSPEWSCCSGLWQTEKYGETDVLRLTKENWSSVHPADSLYEGAEIQYAAWSDPRLLARNEVQFEMHVFKFLGARAKKIRKGDFVKVFRERAGARILGFGNHDMQRGGGVVYAGRYRYTGAADLISFLVRDFDDFASLAPLVDARLVELYEG